MPKSPKTQKIDLFADIETLKPKQIKDEKISEDNSLIGMNDANIINTDMREIYNDSIDSIDRDDKDNQPFTEMEQKFIQNTLSMQFPDQNSAMKSAGFVNGSDQNIYALGCRILGRFISQTGNTGKIFRLMGINEIEAGRGLIKLAKDARSESARIAAWTLICKILAMIKDNNEGNKGDMIINIFKQEITKSYEVTQIAINPTPDHTANTQKRYELPGPGSDHLRTSEGIVNVVAAPRPETPPRWDPTSRPG